MQIDDLDKLKSDPLIRKLIEDVTETSEKRNKTLLSAVPDLLFRLSKSGIILDYKASDMDSLYVKPEFFLNKNIREIFPPNIIDIVIPKLEAAFTTLQIQTFDYNLQMEKGVCFYEARIVANVEENEAVVIVKDVTREREILNKFQMLSTALEQTMDTVFITDLNGNIIYVNSALEQIYGYSKSELLGQNPRIFKSGIKDSDFYKDLWNTILNGESFRSEVINRKKDKTYVYEDRIITPIKDDKGEIKNFLSVGRDITDLKTKEMKIAKNEKKLKSLLQSSFDGLVVVNNNGRIIEVNDAYCKMSGYTREELLGMNLNDVDAIKSKDDIELHMKRVYEEGRDKFESLQTRKDGNKYNVEVSVINTGDGNLISFIKDITRQKQTENELIIRNQVIDNSTSCISIISLDGQITYANPSFLKMFAAGSEKDMLNISLYKLVEDPDKLKNVFDVLLSDSVYSGELKIKRNDGEIITVKLSCNLIKNTEGVPVSMSAFLD